MENAMTRGARALGGVAFALATLALMLGPLVGPLPAAADSSAQVCPPLSPDIVVTERACRRADEIGQQAGALINSWPSAYEYYRPHPPYPGDNFQRPYPWEVLGSPFIPVLPLREIDFMGIFPSPLDPDYGRLIRYYMTPLAFAANYREATPYLFDGRGPAVLDAWARYLNRSTANLPEAAFRGDGVRSTIAAWLRESGYLVGDGAADITAIAQQIAPRPPPAAPPPVDLALEAQRTAWWIAHNSCAVALGRNMLVSQQMIPPDAYEIGIDHTDDPGQGFQDSLILTPGIQTIGGLGFASGNETLLNWDYLPSLLRDLRTQTPPLFAQPIFVSYISALAGMQTAGGVISETRMDVAPGQTGPAVAEFTRQLGRLEGLWPGRPRIDLADCQRFWQ
jgi:hypothetical protein